MSTFVGENDNVNTGPQDDRRLDVLSSASEDHARLMLDAASLCCQIWDRDLKLIDCNEAGIRLYGPKSRASFVERFSACSPTHQPDGQRSDEKAVQYIQKAFQDGRSVCNWMHQTPDHVPIPTEITFVRVAYKEDYVVVCYTHDMQEHYQMLRDIEYRDTLLHTVNYVATMLLNADVESYEEALYDSMGLIAKAVRADRLCIWENRTIDEQLCHALLYEWSEGAETQQDKDYALAIPYLPRWIEVLSSGNCINGPVRDMPAEEHKNFTAGGLVSILAVPIIISGQFWGFVGFDDCHNERYFSENEESILRSGGLMVVHAFFRNEMVHNIWDTSIQLETALFKANEANRAKSDFLSNMSHEMRTPMNAIIGMTTIAMRTEDVEEKNKALSKIGDASSHLLGVIDDVLDMAKIEANKLELSFVSFDFAKMIQRAITVVEFRVEEKQQQLSLRLDEQIPPSLVGDDQRLTQVLTNLLSNAVKFTPEKGEIHLDASLVCEDDGVCELRIEVQDSGIGISKDQQARLFSAFEQADSGTSREYGGTGLGLVISKRIIELMEGNIWVESELGKGARFTFTIKLGIDREEQTPAHEPSAPSEPDKLEDKQASYVGEFDGKRLLIAEDIEINCEILIALLDGTGLLIDCAVNGQVALNMVASQAYQYDIVFMDLQMPHMDGLEATRRIRALQGQYFTELPIIAMTANVFKEDIDACMAAGMDGHLGKPLDIDKVFDTLRTYL